MDPKAHWENVYATKAADRVSWFQQSASVSINMIDSLGLPAGAHLIDVGGGASVLVDGLLERRVAKVSVLDLSATALSVARKRLGARAHEVEWIEADITNASLPPHAFDVWHDRAVFHFLSHPEQRARYVATALRAVKPGGHVIVAAFAPDGPTQCSGLPTVRYAPEALHHEFGARFELLRHVKEAHNTPFGTVQQFVYCLCRREESLTVRMPGQASD